MSRDPIRPGVVTALVDGPVNVVPIRAVDEDYSAHDATQIAGRVAARRGAHSLEIAIADADGRLLEVDVMHSPSESFRVQAIAWFPDGHSVIGSTHPIDKVDWFTHCATRYDEWQIVACADLLDQFGPLTPEEAAACLRS